jgi:hypothetical protein
MLLNFQRKDGSILKVALSANSVKATYFTSTAQEEFQRPATITMDINEPAGPHLAPDEVEST